MKKKDIDEGYIVGDFYIIKSPIKEGWLHIVNIKTSWQIKVMMGANTAKFLSLPQQEIFDRINGIYDSDYALKIAKDAVSYMSEKAKKMGKLGNTENEDIEKVKKDEFMMKIATSSDEEIMEMIVNGEINYKYFKQEQED